MKTLLFAVTSVLKCILWFAGAFGACYGIGRLLQSLPAFS
jgi:hypothetical protein